MKGIHTMPKYRSAIIGCGGRAYGHANAYQQVSQGELVACANRSDTARREKFAETFGITGYANAEEMLRTEKPISFILLPCRISGVNSCRWYQNLGCQRASLKSQLPAVLKIGVAVRIGSANGYEIWCRKTIPLAPPTYQVPRGSAAW